VPAGWVSAGVAVLGAAENMDANSKAASAAKKNNAGAAQLAGAQGSMLNQAEAVSQQPFTPYTGTLTAPLSGNEQQGVSLASRTATDGTAQGLNTKANSLIDQVGGSNWNADTAAKYMNPYTQAVTDSSIANANKTYLQNLSGIQTGEAGSSAFGGSRGAIQEAELAGQHELNVGSLTATGNANAYDSAMKAWSADNTTKLNAADAYNRSGMDVTNMTSQQISDLMKTGGVQQVVAQTDLANQYGQFLRQQGWSANQLNSLINAVGTAKGSITQQAPVQSNTANQLLGLGSTIAGLFGGGSSSAGGNSGVPTGDVTGGITYSDPMAGMTSAPPPSMPSIQGG
jgi:hypothetical protein